MRRIVHAVSISLIVPACTGPGVHAPPVERPSVSVEPESPLSEVPRVGRIRVAHFPGPASALVLFRGDLSSYSAGRLREGLVPVSLEERRIATFAYDDEQTGEAVLVPSEPLDGGETYALAGLGLGALVSLTVAFEQRPFARRVWPPVTSSLGSSTWVFCADEPLPAPSEEVRFEPAGIPAVSHAGADDAGTLSDRCWRFDFDGHPAVGAVPPPAVSGVDLDPMVGSVNRSAETVAPVACATDRLRVGLACGRVEDDRLVLEVPEDPIFWTYLAPDGPHAASTTGGQLSLGDLTPGSHVRLIGSARDLSGAVTPFDVEFDTREAASHIVLNEVLANAVGPEPAQEWIEIYNSGATDAALTGLSLADAQSVTPLPGGTVAPGEFALLVSAAFDVTATEDVPVRPNTLLIRLPALSRSGLSNAGEELRLLDSQGEVVSRFPARKASAAGVSVARVSPDAPDDDPRSFSPHAEPGASPGWANTVAP